MASYLIEVPHSENKIDCIRAIQVFLTSGSHFLVNADWGCEDGEHKAWIIVDLNNKEEALQIVPPLYRRQAKIVRLTKYSRETMEKAVSQSHKS